MWSMSREDARLGRPLRPGLGRALTLFSIKRATARAEVVDYSECFVGYSVSTSGRKV